MNQVLFGDCRGYLRDMNCRGERVQMVVTSPPYWGLRNYGTEPLLWEDGWMGSLGLESTPEMYVRHIVEIFTLVFKVLRDDGTLWLNLGDTYATGSGKVGACPSGGTRGDRFVAHFGIRTPGSAPAMNGITQPNRMPIHGYRPKELVGIPWLCAFALRSSGWILRQEIIWNKSNVMPESAKDRCTRSHEQIFLFTKSRKYYFNSEAIKEPTTGNAHDRGRGVHLKAKKIPNNWDTSLGEGEHDRYKKEGKHSRIHIARDVQNANRTIHANRSFSAAVTKTVEYRNKRTVWTVTSSPFKGGHYSTYPPKLIVPCILAGSRKGDIVLDPFFGSGTTGEVCEKLGRRYIGIELNREYEKMISLRTAVGLQL